MCLAVLRNDNLLFRDAVVTMHPPRLLTRRPPARPQRYEKSSAETNENAVFDPTLPECRIFDEVKVRKAGRREDAKRRFRSDSATTQDLRRSQSPKIRTPRERKAPFFDPTLPRRRIFGEVQVRKSERRENTKRRFRSDSAGTQPPGRSRRWPTSGASQRYEFVTKELTGRHDFFIY